MPYEILDGKTQQDQDFLFKLIIIGDSAVGKSCLMHRVTTNEFQEDHEVTVGVQFGTLMVKLQQQVFKLQIWDTAGQESFKSITKIFYRGAHCVILAFDITRLDTFQHLEQWFQEIMMQSEPNVIVILVGNQKDREQYREVSREQAEEFQQKHNIPLYIETSAKTGENVESVFIMAAKILFQNYKDKIDSLKQKAMAKKKIQRERHQATGRKTGCSC